MTNKEKYQALCNREPSIPLFSRCWWLDTVCGKNHWDILLVEENGKITAAMPLYIPHRGVISMPQFTQTMGPWFATVSEDTKYTTRLSRRQDICKTFVDSLRIYTYFLQNFSYEVTDWLPFYWNGYSETTRYTYLLSQIKEESTILENMSPNIRRNISKARDKYHIHGKWASKIEWLSVFFRDFFFHYKDKRMARETFMLLEKGSFEGILCSTYRTFPLLAAQMAAEKFHLPLIADLRDIVEEYAADEYISHAFHTCKWLDKRIADIFRRRLISDRNQVLTKANYVTTVSPWHGCSYGHRPQYVR